MITNMLPGQNTPRSKNGLHILGCGELPTPLETVKPVRRTLVNLYRARILKHLMEAEKSTFRGEGKQFGKT
jgi:hypothetical protein